MSDRRRRYHALLVEDDEEDYILTQDLINDPEGAWLELSWVRDYAAALEATRHDEFDVCLVDYRLSGTHNGIDVVRALVGDGHQMPVIIITGQGTRSIDVEAAQAGAADFLVKGEISAETVLLYKAYAFFGDARLPQSYVGTPPGQQDHGIMMEIADRWSSLSAPTQQLLEPFLTPPTYAGSWYASGSAVKTPTTQSALDDWTQIPTARAIVWYRAADPGAQTAANNLAAEVANARE